MKRDDARKIFTKFLESEDLSVLALSGRWGVGKTHLLKEYLRGKWPGKNLNGYSYVSLFGATDLADLRTKATENMVLNRDRKAVIDRYKSRAKEALVPFDVVFATSSKLLRIFRDGWSGIASDATYWFVRDALIVLDDIERADDSITPTVIMGFVDELRARNCKVILVLNREKVGDRESYDTYWEKVVDVDISLTPNIAEDIGLSYRLDGKWANYAAWSSQVFQAVNADNLRVQKRAAWLLRELDPLLEGRSADLQQFVVTHAALLTWAILDPDARVPAETVQSTEFGYLYLAITRGKRNEKELSRHEVIWAKATERLAFSPAPFDVLLIELLQTGWCDSRSLDGLLSSAEEEFRGEANRMKLRRAYDIYGEDFQIDRAGFARKLRETIGECLETLSIFDVDAALSQMQVNGEDPSDLAKEFIAKRPDHIQKVAEALSRHQKITNPMLLAEVSRREQAYLDNRYTIDAVAEHFASNDSWGSDQLTFLANRTPEEFRRWIDARPPDLRPKIRAVLKLRQYGGGEYIAAAGPLESALLALAAESEFNRIRIADVYGVTASPQ